jgi:hypothetical protein
MSNSLHFTLEALESRLLLSANIVDGSTPNSAPAESFVNSSVEQLENDIQTQQMADAFKAESNSVDLFENAAPTPLEEADDDSMAINDDNADESNEVVEDEYSLAKSGLAPSLSAQPKVTENVLTIAEHCIQRTRLLTLDLFIYTVLGIHLALIILHRLPPALLQQR